MHPLRTLLAQRVSLQEGRQLEEQHGGQLEEQHGGQQHERGKLQGQHGGQRQQAQQEQHGQQDSPTTRRSTSNSAMRAAAASPPPNAAATFRASDLMTHPSGFRRARSVSSVTRAHRRGVGGATLCHGTAPILAAISLFFTILDCLLTESLLNMLNM